VWRMMDARYEIMQALIRGQCVSLIRTILFEKDDKSPRGISSRLSKHLHFPRLYAWPLEQKESDLQVAINYSGDRRIDTMIVGYLLNYYSDNAMNNAGWMFTVTKALPDLYDHNMEIQIDTSLINRSDLFEGRFKLVHSLYIKRELLRRPATKPREKNQIIQKISDFFSYEKVIEEVEELEEVFKDKKTG
ncbi:6279_t:CDS:2, partial [Racocetra fulgida]